jgi:imidazolonepropionase-like amidohydrolase
MKKKALIRCLVNQKSWDCGPQSDSSTTGTLTFALPYRTSMSISLTVLSLILLTGLLWTFSNSRMQAQSRDPQNHSVLLRPERIFDATGSETHTGWGVLVADNKIQAVGPLTGLTTPPQARVYDLPGMTLLPGLIDAHSHIFLHPYNEARWDDQVLKEPLAYRTLRAAVHCKDTLMAGFTTLRDLGTEGAAYADVSLRQAIMEGLVPGPRLQVATRAIVATACYGPGPAGFAPEWVVPKGAQEASGRAEIVKAVREQIGQGANWVKVYADYRRGVADKEVPTFSEEELEALIGESHSAGCRVAAHAASPEGMRRAVLAGADTIEHGTGGTSEIFQLMAKKRVAYLPTLTAVEAYGEYFQGYRPGISPPTDDMKRVKAAFRLARQLGVTIGAGSDVGVFRHGDNHRELEWMVNYGMSPAEALLACTATNARILGWQEQIGQIRPGLLADLIAVEGNPLLDIKALRKVAFVMKEGRVYKEPTSFRQTR